jgi:tryptophan synthase alpha chain
MKDNKMQIAKKESLSKVDKMFCELKNKKKISFDAFHNGWGSQS